MTRDIKTWQFENLTFCENCGSNFSVSALGWYTARVCNVKGSGSYKACGQIHHMWFSEENQDSSGLLFLVGQSIFKWMGFKWQGLTEGKVGQGLAHQTSSNKKEQMGGSHTSREGRISHKGRASQKTGSRPLNKGRVSQKAGHHKININKQSQGFSQKEESHRRQSLTEARVSQKARPHRSQGLTEGEVSQKARCVTHSRDSHKAWFHILNKEWFHRTQGVTCWTEA